VIYALGAISQPFELYYGVILDALVEDEHKRGKLILEQYKRAEELNKRLEWDFDRPALIDCRMPSDEEFLPEHLQGFMRLKQR
jgi:hypothetical protein